MDLAQRFADHVVDTDFDDLPDDAVSAARVSVIDAVSAILAGSSAPGVEAITKVVESWSGSPEASIALSGKRVSAVAAAYANGTMARARDIDDVHDTTGDHPGIGPVVATLAMAEFLGDVDGKQAFAAIALGVDVVLRIRLAGKTPPAQLPWTTGTYAPIGAAVAAGKLLNLDRARMLDCIGIAYTQMSNTRQSSKDGALVHRVHHGMAIGNGIMAALLARAELSGPANSLEGTWGYYNAFEGGHYEAEDATRALGKEFRGTQVRIKRFSCCAHTHYSIDNMLAIRKQHKFLPDDVVEVRAFINDRGFKSVCEPIERKWTPQTIVDAQWSLPYVVAVAAVTGDVFINDLTDEGIRRPDILRFARKVQPIKTNVSNDSDDAIMPCAIEVVLKDGRRLKSDLPALKGSPLDPLQPSEMTEKLRKCAALASSPIEEARIAEFSEAVATLEGRNVGEVISALW